MSKQPKQFRIINDRRDFFPSKFEVVSIQKLDAESTNLDHIFISRKVDTVLGPAWQHIGVIAGRGEFRVGDEVGFIPAGVLLYKSGRKERQFLSTDYIKIEDGAKFHLVRERKFRGVVSPGLIFPWSSGGNAYCLTLDQIEVIPPTPAAPKDKELKVPDGYRLIAPYYEETGRRIIKHSMSDLIPVPSEDIRISTDGEFLYIIYKDHPVTVLLPKHIRQP